MNGNDDGKKKMLAEDLIKELLERRSKVEEPKDDTEDVQNKGYEYICRNLTDDEKAVLIIYREYFPKYPEIIKIIQKDMEKVIAGLLHKKLLGYNPVLGYVDLSPGGMAVSYMAGIYNVRKK